MSYDLTFDTEAGPYDALPENYMPQALSFRSGNDTSDTAVKLVAPLRGLAAAQDVPAATLRDPAAMDGVEMPSYLVRDLVGDGQAAPPPGGAPFGANRAYGIIDTGIAFWNPAFRAGAAAGVNPIRQLAFLKRSHSAVLDAAAMAPFYTVAQRPDGEERIFAQLATDHPASVYGHGLRPGHMSHGTMTAGLIAEAAKQPGQDPVPVYCVELPYVALQDKSGDSMQAYLLAALGQLVDMARADMGAGQITLDVALPFAFLGGPLSDAHPANALLQQMGGSQVDLRLYVPTGNHRQDRLLARLDDLKKGKASDDLVWRLRHDDHSSNSVEIVFQGGDDTELLVTAPMGVGASVTLADGSVSWLSQGGNVIGGLHCRRGPDGRRVRFSLLPTASNRPGDALASCGDWRLALKAGKAAVKGISLHILRDDGHALPGPQPPDRPSQFVDPAYRLRDERNWYPMGDDPGSAVKRSDTGAVMAHSSAVIPVKALQDWPGAANPRDAWYSGLAEAAPNPVVAELVETRFDSPGLACLASGTARIYKVSGTSVAAAMATAARR